MLQKQDLPTRAALLALIYSVCWLLIHWLWLQPNLPVMWIFPQLLSSFLIYLCLNGLFSTFNFYKWSKWVQPLVSLFYFLPVFQIPYFQTYKTLLEQQNISLLLREPMFVLNIFAKEASLLQAVVFVGIWILFHTVNRIFLSQELHQESKLKPFFLFSSRVALVLIFLGVASQVKWCLDHDPSLLIMRPFYPVTIFGLISVFIFIVRHPSKLWKKVFIGLALVLNGWQLYALNLGYPDLRDKMTADARFYRALFGAYFVDTALGTLDQTQSALDKFAHLPKAKMDYNILVILDDSQRWDYSNRHGQTLETDRSLDWFYDQALDFKYPIAPANFTDTSVPAIITGLGSNRDVLQIKGSLLFWDFFAKGADTFFLSTQPLGWSHLDLFFKSVGLKKLWGATESAFKGNPENVNDSFVVNEFKNHLNETQSPFVGVVQTFGSHYPYTAFPGAPQPYGPCDLTRASGLEPFRNCYLNGQVSVAFAKNEILKHVDLSRTIVILTSDHGEGMNEHGVWFHGVDYHQEMIKVPFFVYLPPSLKQKIPADLMKNLEKNTQRVISTMDLVPTLLDLHEVLTGQKLADDLSIFSGKSLLRTWNDRVVFSTHCFPQYRCYSREIAFVNDDFYVLFRPSEGFYKIYSTHEDPKQEKPLSPKSIPSEKLQRFVERAAEVHSIGQSMKAYYQSNRP